MKDRNFLKKVEVFWNDITFFSGKYELDEIDKLKVMEIKTIGYLLKSEKKSLTIALSLLKDNLLMDIYKIPKGCITKIKFI